MEKIVIEITNDPKSIDTTIQKLQKLGQVDEQNAKKFQHSHNEFKQQVADKDSVLNKFEEGTKNRFLRIGEYAAAAFAADRILEWTKEAINAYELVQKAANELKFATTNIAGESIEQFKKLKMQSEELSASLNNLFSPRQIMDAQSMLLRAGLSAKQVMEMLPRIADISAKTGKPLSELAGAFDRAIAGGRAQELRQLGINFQSTGDKVKDFNLIMQNSTQYIGGAKDAMGDLANQAQESSNKLEILQEMVGKQIAPVWEQFKLDILGVVHALLDFQGTVKLTELGFIEQQGINVKEWMTGNEQMLASRIAMLKKVTDNEKESYEKRKLYAILLRYVQESYDTLYAKSHEQATQEIINSEQNLTKLSMKELEIRLSAAKNESKTYVSEKGQTINDMEHLNSMGFEKEVARINKEIEARKKANEKLLELQKKYQEELKSIQDSVQKDSDRLLVEGAKTEIEKKKMQENVRFDEEIAQRRKSIDKLTEIIQNGTAKEAALAAELQAQIYKNSEKALEVHNQKLKEIQDEFEQKAIENVVKERGKAVELENDFEKLMLNQAKMDLQKRLDARKITQEQYNIAIDRLDLAYAKDKQANDKVQYDTEQRLIEEKYQAGLIDKQQYNNELKELDNKRIEDEQAITEKEIKLQEDTQKSFKKAWKQIASTVQESSDIIFELLSKQNEEQQKANDYRISQQDSNIEVEKALAEKGLANDLAQEERKRAALTEQQIKLQIIQKKQKELQAFLNAFVKFTETDPKTAFLKASEVVAEMKIAEAVYAEQGGIIGMQNDRSLVGPWGMSKRHRSGKDVLIHGEFGEGILSTKEMANLGNDNFLALKAMLKQPFRDTVLPSVNDAMRQDNKELHAKLDELIEVVANKKETSIDWEGLDMRITEIEKGISRTTVYKH